MPLKKDQVINMAGKKPADEKAATAAAKDKPTPAMIKAAVENLSLWERSADIDPAFTKPITGRAYKGSSPNPMYLHRMATKEFGPIGKGYGYKVIAENFERLGQDDFLHWCRIEFWWRDKDGLYCFESYGQTKASYRAQSGKQIVDEDAPKKSLTDAVSKALSQLGFAASIYLGLYDDAKYVARVRTDFADDHTNGASPDEPITPAAPPPKRAGGTTLTDVKI